MFTAGNQEFSLFNVIYVDTGVDEKEGSEILQNSTKDLLRSGILPIFRVVPNAFVGLEYTEHTCYDLAIVKKDLPHLGAMDMLRILRHVGAPLPFILLMDAEDPMKDSDALSLGFVGVLRKPFTALTLCSLVKFASQCQQHHAPPRSHANRSDTPSSESSFTSHSNSAPTSPSIESMVAKFSASTAPAAAEPRANHERSLADYHRYYHNNVSDFMTSFRDDEEDSEERLSEANAMSREEALQENILRSGLSNISRKVQFGETTSSSSSAAATVVDPTAAARAFAASYHESEKVAAQNRARSGSVSYRSQPSVAPLLLPIDPKDLSARARAASATARRNKPGSVMINRSVGGPAAIIPNSVLGYHEESSRPISTRTGKPKRSYNRKAANPSSSSTTDSVQGKPDKGLSPSIAAPPSQDIFGHFDFYSPPQGLQNLSTFSELSGLDTFSCANNLLTASSMDSAALSPRASLSKDQQLRGHHLPMGREVRSVASHGVSSSSVAFENFANLFDEDHQQALVHNHNHHQRMTAAATLQQQHYIGVESSNIVIGSAVSRTSHAPSERKKRKDLESSTSSRRSRKIHKTHLLDAASSGSSDEFEEKDDHASDSDYI